MARVALFGGSFNPPHVAHQMVALYVLETQPVDELWFVPTYTHPFGKDLVAYDHRIAMCELAAAPLGGRAQVSRAEAELAARPGFVASRTLDLVELVAARGHAPRLVVGADILGEAEHWYRWDDVIAAAPLIVIGRGGHPVPPGSVATEITMPEVSATQVRERLAGGSPDVTGLVPRNVLRYIAEHHLYQP
ncbi:MAG TPA: nicotinate-nicotinamide nucleotide adenylyltransferase [Kofleriaceae bacterium]|jgi:nicotinate-nucleotide adenylyltransferase|nr:nicotinate-nicotinamide nucleotide adenylyltransferase [Kofleriaceae bacterium]